MTTMPKTCKRDLCADLADDPAWYPPYDSAEDFLISCGWMKHRGLLIRLWLRRPKDDPDGEVCFWVIWRDARGEMDERYAAAGPRDLNLADLGLSMGVPDWRIKAYQRIWDFWKQGAR